MQSYIHDGYTEDGYIAESKRLYSDLRFRYRPLLVAERTACMALIEKKEPRAQDGVRADVMKRQLVSWDLKHDGQAVPIETQHILRLQPSLFLALWYIITGIAASDDDGGQQAGDAASGASELEAALAGLTKPEADAKN